MFCLLSAGRLPAASDRAVPLDLLDSSPALMLESLHSWGGATAPRLLSWFTFVGCSGTPCRQTTSGCEQDQKKTSIPTDFPLVMAAEQLTAEGRFWRYSDDRLQRKGPPEERCRWPGSESMGALFPLVNEARAKFAEVKYIVDEDTIRQVYFASVMQKPILIEGPGKTELAKAVPHALEAKLKRLHATRALMKKGSRMADTLLLQTLDPAACSPSGESDGRSADLGLLRPTTSPGLSTISSGPISFSTMHNAQRRCL